jgi:hypothetical protein
LGCLLLEQSTPDRSFLRVCTLHCFAEEKAQIGLLKIPFKKENIFTLQSAEAGILMELCK